MHTPYFITVICYLLSALGHYYVKIFRYFQIDKI